MSHNTEDYSPPIHTDKADLVMSENMEHYETTHRILSRLLKESLLKATHELLQKVICQKNLP